MRMVIVALLCLLALPGVVLSEEESSPWVALRVK